MGLLKFSVFRQIRHFKELCWDFDLHQFGYKAYALPCSLQWKQILWVKKKSNIHSSRKPYCINVLVLPQNTTDWTAKTTERFSHSSGGQKSNVKVLGDSVYLGAFLVWDVHLVLALDKIIFSIPLTSSLLL